MAHTWDEAASSATADADQGSRQEGRRGWKSSELLVMIGGFIVFWPLGLAALSLKYGWLGLDRWTWGQRQWARLPGSARLCSGKNSASSARSATELRDSSGNSAFDGWKTSELARLQKQYEELAASQKSFEAFLQQLRETKDRETFERFMADRPKGA